MVKRYPHKAIVTIESEGGIVNGEWVEGTTTTVEVVGRFDPVDTDNIIRENSQGAQVVVKGEFFTQHKKLDDAVKIEIAELGIKRDVICWWQYQSHSVISV